MIRVFGGSVFRVKGFVLLVLGVFLFFGGVLEFVFGVFWY